jgi:hypothetical protein
MAACSSESRLTIAGELTSKRLPQQLGRQMIMRYVSGRPDASNMHMHDRLEDAKGLCLQVCSFACDEA